METYMKADSRNPFMSLNNEICKSPVYWCRLHQVWLSREDVKRKNCRSKMDYNMIGTHRCGNLVKKV